MKAITNYKLSYCESLIERYINEFGGGLLVINEGCLGLGTILLYGATGKKTILITEFFINSWVSGHKIRKYNKLPKKYEKLILQNT